MDTNALMLIISLALGISALGIILYPLRLQKTRSEAIIQSNRAGQMLTEYQARYQAALAAIKDLMFDHEMGKVATEDYKTLLARTKLEAAKIRHQMDRLTDGNIISTVPLLDVEIETLITQQRDSHLNDQESLLSEINREIDRLKSIKLDTNANRLVCSRCGQFFEIGDSFCSHCGQLLVDIQAEVDENRCPKCDYTFQSDDAFCAKCGTALNKNVRIGNDRATKIAELSV